MSTVDPAAAAVVTTRHRTPAHQARLVVAAIRLPTAVTDALATVGANVAV